MNKRPPDTQNKQQEPTVPSLLRELWTGSCTRYTVLCLLLLLVSAMVSDSLTVTYVDTVRFVLLLPFAFCLTLATRIRRADKLATGAKCALHPITVLGGFYLCCYLPFQISTKPSGQQILILLLLAALVYGVTMGIVCLIAHRKHSKELEATPYVSQYSRK